MDLTLCKLRNEFYLKFLSEAEKMCRCHQKCVWPGLVLFEPLTSHDILTRIVRRGRKIIKSMLCSFIVRPKVNENIHSMFSQPYMWLYISA